MKKYVNGNYIELAQEELAQMGKEARLAAIAERTRPLMEVVGLYVEKTN